MNEEELKDLWRADERAPVIDFAALEKSMDDWHAKLRRKTRIDVWAQSVTCALCLIPIFFYPRIIFASLAMVAVGVWYVRELRAMSAPSAGGESLPVSQSLNEKAVTMEKYFRRTRFVMYALTPLIFHAAVYGLGHYDKPPTDNTDDWNFRLIESIVFTTVLYEILTVIATEIYFKTLYKPALDELKNLRRQLDF